MEVKLFILQQKKLIELQKILLPSRPLIVFDIHFPNQYFLVMYTKTSYFDFNKVLSIITFQTFAVQFCKLNLRFEVDKYCFSIQGVWKLNS